jgi:hypothetical protein
MGDYTYLIGLTIALGIMATVGWIAANKERNNKARKQ